MRDITYALVPPNVAEWPTWARRAFVLTLPISGPLWVLWALAFVVGAVGFGVAAMALVVAAYVVTPFACALIWVWQFAADMWFSPSTETPTVADAAREGAPLIPVELSPGRNQ